MIELEGTRLSGGGVIVTHPKIRLLTELVKELSSRGLVILHGYSSYPDYIPSDVDVLGPPEIVRFLRDRVLEGEYNVVQVLQHETSSFYWVFWTPDSDGGNEFLQFDFASDYR